MTISCNRCCERSVVDVVEFARKTLTSEGLGRLFWLSGSTCSGKTTISSAIAERLNWNVYHCDELEASHRERADQTRHPNWAKYSAMTGDSLWLQPVDQHLALESRAALDQFELIIDDLTALLKADSRLVLYDGFVAPEILAHLIPAKMHAFYLVATELFQRTKYAERDWIQEVLSKTSDPKRAWANWMARDVAGARSLERTLSELHLPWMLVDGKRPVEESINLICNHFTDSAAG